MDLLNEANRCLKCKMAQCRAHCPVDTPIPEVMRLVGEGNIHEAGRILFDNNPLSAITSVVCPHESNCFGHCVLGRKGQSVEFHAIEQYVSHFYMETFQPRPVEKVYRRVAVVGAGPAGITMSLLLSLRGFDVTLIEAKEQIGGVLRFGIPNFRLPKGILDRYDEVLNMMGVKTKPNTFVGSTVMVDDMFLDGYAAVFLAVGTAKPNKLGLLGETLGHVHYAIDYLRSPDTYHIGRRVAVIGAGNVALDAARMARRKIGDGEVTVINNRAETDMTGNTHEIAMARLDGVQFVHQLQTLRLTDEGVLCARVTVHEDENGTRQYEEEMGDRVLIPADTIIVAIGQGPQAAAIAEAEVKRTNRGLFNVDENGRTTQKGVYAAGDVVTGPRTVVQAVAFSKKVALDIERYCLTETKPYKVT